MIRHELWRGPSYQTSLCTMAPDPLLPSMKQPIKYLANVEITSLLESLAFLRTMEDTQIFVNASALRLDQVWLVYDAMRCVATRFPP